MAISVLTIDDQALLRLGLRTAVENEPDIEIVGESETGTDGLELFKRLEPDVTILSLRLPDFCAADDLGIFLSERPDAGILVVATNAGDAEIIKTLESGAGGFLDDRVNADEIVRAIRTVSRGSRYIPLEISKAISTVQSVEKLTQAETTVLQMIVGGMSNKEIAFKLDVSDNTIKTHVRHIFEKLGVSDRTSATVAAIKRGLVRVDI